MSHQETVSVQTGVLHAVKIKGIAPSETISEMSGISQHEVDDAAQSLTSSGDLSVVEGRMAGYRLTPQGKQRHGEEIAASPQHEKDAAAVVYDAFIPLNDRLKEICGAWQVKPNGEPNDHGDDVYDATVVERLSDLHDDTVTALAAGAACPRFDVYRRRFQAALDRVKAGETAAFARPMAKSYHDVWMELHQELLLTLGRERGAADGH